MQLKFSTAGRDYLAQLRPDAQVHHLAAELGGSFLEVQQGPSWLTCPGQTLLAELGLNDGHTLRVTEQPQPEAWVPPTAGPGLRWRPDLNLPQENWQLPVRAVDKTSPRFPFLILIVPPVLGVSVYFFTGRLASLLLVALLPLMMIGFWVENRRTVRRDNAKAQAEYATAVEQLEERVRTAKGKEFALRHGYQPALRTMLAAVRQGAPLAFSRAGFQSDPIRVGIGAVPSSIELTDTSGAIPSQSDSRLRQLHAEAERIADVPVTCSLVGGLGVVGPRAAALAVARALVLTAATRYTPASTRISVVAGGRAADWQWLRWLPHSHEGSSEQIRLVDEQTTAEFTVADGGVVLAASLAELPGQIERAIVIDPAVASDQRATTGVPARLVHRLTGEVITCTADAASAAEAESAARTIARHSPPNRTADPLAKTVSLVELLNEELSCGTRVPLGRMPDGSPLLVDIVRQGPHALVAGTTGAGKSELLRSWLLALLDSCSPSELNVALIDHKGGAAFADLRALPHCVGFSTDLSADSNRILAGIAAEVVRREELLAAAGLQQVEESELPRLLIVVDELAALLDSDPAQVDLLIDFARRGRSLGIHLLLATQRPGGVVNAELRANLNLRLALRVADSADSIDVVGESIAADFPVAEPGRVAVSVGAEPVIVAQAGHCGLPPTPIVQLQPLTGGGVTSREGATQVEGRGQHGEQDRPATAVGSPMTELLQRAQRWSESANHAPWLPELPTEISWRSTEVGLPLGICDLPKRQKQAVVSWVDGHLLVVGGPESGKSAALRMFRNGADPRTTRVFGVADTPAPLAPGTALDAWVADADTVAALLTWLEKRVTEELHQIARAGDDENIVVLVDGADFVTDPRFTGRWERLLKSSAAKIQVAMAVGALADLPRVIQQRFGQHLVLAGASQSDQVQLGWKRPLAETRHNPGWARFAGEQLQVFAAPPPSRTQRRWVASGVTSLPRAVPLPSEPTLAESSEDLPIGWSNDPVGMVTVPQQGAVVVAGPRHSGRSNVLAVLAAAARARNRQVVWLKSGCNWSAVESAVQAEPGKYLTLVPDVADILDQLGPLVRLAEQELCCLVVRAQTRDLVGRVAAELRSSVGILTRPTVLDAELHFRSKIPQRNYVDDPPGRVLILREGRQQLCQVFLAAT